MKECIPETRHRKERFALADIGERMFHKGRYKRGHMIFRKNINMTPWTLGGGSGMPHQPQYNLCDNFHRLRH